MKQKGLQVGAKGWWVPQRAWVGLVSLGKSGRLPGGGDLGAGSWRRRRSAHVQSRCCGAGGGDSRRRGSVAGPRGRFTNGEEAERLEQE